MRMGQVKRIWSWGRAGGDRDTRLLCGATWASGELLLYLFVLRKLYSGGNGLDWTGLIRRRDDGGKEKLVFIVGRLSISTGRQNGRLGRMGGHQPASSSTTSHP